MPVKRQASKPSSWLSHEQTFFGQLRSAEFERVMESTTTLLRIILLFFKLFHLLEESRLHFLERSPIRISLTILMAHMDGLLIQHAYHRNKHYPDWVLGATAVIGASKLEGAGC